MAKETVLSISGFINRSGTVTMHPSLRFNPRRTPVNIAVRDYIETYECDSVIIAIIRGDEWPDFNPRVG